MKARWWLLIGACFAAMISIIAWRVWTFRVYTFPSASMAPTIQQGERIAVRRIDGCRTQFERGAVVRFVFPHEEKTLYLKRIVAFGGETIELRHRELLIDGKPQGDPHASYVNEPERSLNYPATKVPDGHFFVLGDNRDRSSDSRVWGTVPCALVNGIWIPRE